jgi:hypothetical protein
MITKTLRAIQQVLPRRSQFDKVSAAIPSAAEAAKRANVAGVCVLRDAATDFAHLVTILLSGMD